jgi:hypothetical protein
MRRFLLAAMFLSYVCWIELANMHVDTFGVHTMYGVHFEQIQCQQMWNSEISGSKYATLTLLPQLNLLVSFANVLIQTQQWRLNKWQNTKGHKVAVGTN